jgi:hypothetical protein
MLKTIVTIILIIFIALVIFWPRLKEYLWFKICRRIVDQLMGGEKQ